MTFDAWMDEVDRCCQLDFGLSIRDLPDMLFRDAFDSGLSAREFMAENLPDYESLREALLS